jgi:hypothetical protein
MPVVVHGWAGGPALSSVGDSAVEAQDIRDRQKKAQIGNQAYVFQLQEAMKKADEEDQQRQAQQSAGEFSMKLLPQDMGQPQDQPQAQGPVQPAQGPTMGGSPLAPGPTPTMATPQDHADMAALGQSHTQLAQQAAQIAKYLPPEGQARLRNDVSAKFAQDALQVRREQVHRRILDMAAHGAFGAAPEGKDGQGDQAGQEDIKALAEAAMAPDSDPEAVLGEALKRNEPVRQAAIDEARRTSIGQSALQDIEALKAANQHPSAYAAGLANDLITHRISIEDFQKEWPMAKLGNVPITDSLGRRVWVPEAQAQQIQSDMQDAAKARAELSRAQAEEARQRGARASPFGQMLRNAGEIAKTQGANTARQQAIEAAAREKAQVATQQDPTYVNAPPEQRNAIYQDLFERNLNNMLPASMRSKPGEAPTDPAGIMDAIRKEQRGGKDPAKLAALVQQYRAAQGQPGQPSPGGAGASPPAAPASPPPVASQGEVSPDRIPALEAKLKSLQDGSWSPTPEDYVKTIGDKLTGAAETAVNAVPGVQTAKKAGKAIGEAAQSLGAQASQAGGMLRQAWAQRVNEMLDSVKPSRRDMIRILREEIEAAKGGAK